MKTKLGISTGALAALAYFASAFSGYFALLLVAGYILLAEEDMWLKRMAIKAVTFTVAVSLALFVVGLIPSAFELINDVISLFNGEYLSVEFIDELVILIKAIVRIASNIVLVLLGIKAFKNSTLYIPVVDSIVNKITK